MLRQLLPVCLLLLSGATLRAATTHHFIYFDLERDRIRDAAFLASRAEGAQLKYTWRELEPQKDRYDFSAIRRDHEFLHLKGKKLFIQLQDVSFYDSIVNVPPYLREDPIYRGGVARQYEIEGNREDAAKPGGWVARRWDPAVRERFRLLLLALGKEFDGKIEGINLAETSVVFGETGKLFPAGFTHEAYRDGILANFAALREAFPRSVKIQYVNFMPGEWLPRTDKGYLESVYRRAAELGVGVGGPDLLPYRRSQMNHSYPRLKNAAGKIPTSIAVQDGNYEYVNPKTDKPVTLDELLEFASEYLGVEYLFWAAQEPFYSRQVLPFLNQLYKQGKTVPASLAGTATVLPAITSGQAGMVTRDYSDTARRNWSRTGPRPLRTAIWYPVDSSGELETIFAGPDPLFVPVDLAGGAKLSAKTRKYPLVVMSHGTGGSAIMMMWLGTYLASHGYVVAAVNHHGNTASEKELMPQGFLLYWERAQDLKVAIDSVLRDPMFADRIDRHRIGAAGFSLGGYTVIAAAGGRFDQAEFDRFCSSAERDFTCEPQAEFPEASAKFAILKQSDPVVRESMRRSGASYHDPRIKAVFVIAPALGGGFTQKGLRRVTVPVQIVVGEGDTVTPSSTSAQRYASLIRGAKLTVLPGNVGHYTFLHECTARGRELLPICRDGASVDRAAIHRTTRELALDFFNSALAVQRR